MLRIMTQVTTFVVKDVFRELGAGFRAWGGITGDTWVKFLRLRSHRSRRDGFRFRASCR